MLNGQIAHSYLENSCTLLIPRPPALNQSSKWHQPAAAAAASSSASEELCQGAGVVEAEALHVDRIRNCDIFVDAHDLYFYADVKLYKFHSRRTFDLRELKTLLIRFNTRENHYQICLRCLPLSAGAQEGTGGERGGGGGTGDTAKLWSGRKEYIATFLHLPTLTDATSAHLPDKEHLVQEWKLKRITDQCQLQLDGHERTYKLTNNFGYGYASEYSGPLDASEMISQLDRATCRVSEPHRMSPIQRRQERVVDEMKRFSREQYKINFVELQVPSGHQNPLRYKPKIYETSMTQEQAHLLHNISRKLTREQQPCDVFRQNEIDCGLISILLAICYDVRTTNNEPTCESGWTRSILCPLYCYFEQFDNYRDVLIAFLRRMITYPLYRNFELGRQCVRDAIEVLKGGRNWLINQLLLTHQQFASGDPSRDSFNSYYLEDYIRYVTSPSACSDEHMRLLARNLKNVLMDVNKQHLGLGVTEIETELIKELMQEMRIDAGSDGSSPQQHGHGDDELDLETDTSGQEDETTTDDDSVITDSFDSMDMDMRLIENEIVYEDDEEDEDGDEDDDEDGDGDEDDDDSSSSTSSEAEGNSVIEQCSNSETAASTSTK
ncbi:protein SHQ1 homolog isoform X1 [Drosophila yakuba]|uniref:protein SHQ1 homolog isoform X1 n=1 Tax=Drosophila yakuba TaxID=7245 RepID=UPI0019307677|nr:protein SHQ1 homolog isoform X1 [Drosophila yakuba]